MHFVNKNKSSDEMNDEMHFGVKMSNKLNTAKQRRSRGKTDKVFHLMILWFTLS